MHPPPPSWNDHTFPRQSPARRWFAFLICTLAPILKKTPATLQLFSRCFDVWFIRNRFPEALMVSWWISLWWACFVTLPQIRRVWKMFSLSCDLSQIDRQSLKDDSLWSTFWGWTHMARCNRQNPFVLISVSIDFWTYLYNLNPNPYNDLFFHFLLTWAHLMTFCDQYHNR